MSGHISIAESQPAIHWFDTHSADPIEFKNKPHRLIYASCCEKRQYAKNLIVHSYYDCTHYWCAPGKGCQSEKLLTRKARQAFCNRSKGQKMRWAKRK